MEQIAHNEYYELKIDVKKNWLFITIKGFWREKGNYLSDLEIACEKMKKGFFIQVDLTEMKAPTPSIGEVHQQAQVMLMNYGLAKTAEVHSDNAITRMALRKYSDKSGMSKEVFFSNEEASKWLAKFQH